MQDKNTHEITTIDELKKELDGKTVAILDESAQQIAAALRKIGCSPSRIVKDKPQKTTQVVLVSARDYQGGHYPQIDSKKNICIIQMSVDRNYLTLLQNPHFRKDLLGL